MVETLIVRRTSEPSANWILAVGKIKHWTVTEQKSNETGVGLNILLNNTSDTLIHRREGFVFQIYYTSKKITFCGDVRNACITTGSISSIWCTCNVFGYKSVDSTSTLSFLGLTKCWEPRHLHSSGSTICRKLFDDCSVYLHYRTQDSEQWFWRVLNQEPWKWSSNFKTPILTHLLIVFMCTNKCETPFNFKPIKTPVS
jgi:hypothetical protein